MSSLWSSRKEDAGGTLDSLSDNESNLFVYDSIDVHFSFKVFVWELLVHFFFPLLNWYGTTIHGHNAWHALGIFVNIPSIVMIFTLVSYSLLPNPEGEIIIPLLLYSMHKIMVALKYASLSPSEYSKVVLCTHPKIADIYRNQMQLLSSWLQFDPLVFEFELYAAAARVGVDIDSLHFLVPQHAEKSAEDLINAERAKPRFVIKDRFTSAEKWDLFLAVCNNDKGAPKSIKETVDRAKEAAAARKTASIRQAGKEEVRRRVTIREIMEPLIHYTLESEAHNKNMTIIPATVAAIIIAIVPIFISRPMPTSYRSLHVFFLCCSTFITGLFAWVNFQFLFTATVDLNRRLHLAKLLSLLIRPVPHDFEPKIAVSTGASIGALMMNSLTNPASWVKNLPANRTFSPETFKDIEMGPSKESHGVAADVAVWNKFRYEAYIPRIDPEIPQNIYAWMYTRLVVQNYGKRILVRINAYTGSLLVVTLTVIVAVLIATLHAVRPLLFVQRSVVIQCLIIATVLLIFIIKHIFVGAKLNSECDRHRNQLILNAMRCESELSELLTVINDDASNRLVLRANSDGLIATDGKEGLDLILRLDKQMTPSSSPIVKRNRQELLMEGKLFKSEEYNDSKVGGTKLKLDDDPSHVSHIPQNSYALLTRLKIYELDEAIKAMRRGVEAMDISNDEYSSKVLGIRAALPLLLSLFSSGGAFAIALYRIILADKRYI